MPIEPNAQGLFLADNAAETETTEQNLDTPAAETAAPEELEGTGGSEPASAEEIKPKEDTFSPRFAALTRKDKEIRLREKKLAAREKELEAKFNAQPPPAPEKEPLEVRLKKDPFNTLKELGVPYETLTDMALNEGKPTPELQMRLMREELQREMKAELDAVKAELKAEKEAKEQEKQNVTLRNFKASIADTINANKDTFELVAAEGDAGLDAVVEVINSHYLETEEIISANEALQVVEDRLLEEAKKRIKLGKITRLMEPPQPPKAPPTKPETSKKSSSVTLSNETTQVQPTSGRFLSDEESKREAAKLIKFNS